MKSGSLAWNRSLQARADRLASAAAAVPPEELDEALSREIRRRSAVLADAVLAYRRHPYRRRLAEPPALRRDGSTRLLDYGQTSSGNGREGARGRPVLVVPSLINRAYILDLNEERSLLRWLAGQGFRPLLVDWGRPGETEEDFTLTDYVAGRLELALDTVLERTGEPPLVLGYCMGGLLALALATRRRRDLSGLALLATPWDFHAGGIAQARLASGMMPLMAPALETMGVMPVDMIQWLFAMLDPQTSVRKFLSFAELDPGDPRAEAFVALEDWLNDGVPLTAPVARECLGKWYGENTTARGKWRVAGVPVDPGALALETLCVVPAQDRIVPPASAEGLASALPGATTWRPAIGHIGMIVSGRARRDVWEPLGQWLAKARRQ